MLLGACSGSDGEVDATSSAPGPDDAATTSVDPQARRAAYEGLIQRLTGGDDATAGQLGLFWQAEFDTAFPEVEFEQLAGFVPFEGESVETGCGPLGAGTAAYCIQDQTVYYDQAWMLQLHEALGDAGPALVLAHETAHHVAAQRGPRPEPQAADVQADCYAGRFFDGAFDGEALGPGSIASSTAGAFVVGARLEPGDSWFAGELKGAPWWRSRAFLDGAVGGIEACLAYDEWQDLPDVEVGAFRWLTQPGTEVRRAADDSLRLARGDTTTIVGTVPDPAPGTAAEAMPEVAGAWFDSETPPLLGDPIPVDSHGVSGVSVAVQGYGYTDASGEDRHGMLLLHLPAEGDAAVVSTVRPGAAPEPDDAEGWAHVGVPMFTAATGLCPPDGGAPTCVTE